MAGDTIEKLIIKIQTDMAGVKEDLDGLKGKMGEVDTSTSKLSAGMVVSYAAIAVAIKEAADAVYGMVKFAADAAMEVEQYSVSLGVLYGSQELAAEQLKWIFEFAKSTPFEVDGLVYATIKLKSFGLESQDVLEVLGDTAAATSKPIDQVVNAYGRLSVGDSGQAIAMFRDIGINLKNINELKFDAQGALVTPIAEAMPLVKQYLEGQFGGMMKEQSKTAKGMMSKIRCIKQDWRSWDLTKRQQRSERTVYSKQ